MGVDVHWKAVSDLSDSTYIQEARNDEWYRDSYILGYSEVYWGMRIESVTVCVRAREVGGHGWAGCGLKLADEVVVVGGWQLTDSFQTYKKEIGRPGGGYWEFGDFEDLKVDVALWSFSNIYTQCSEVWVEVKCER